MAIKDWMDDFRKKYERPQMNNVTVGFSGIDPSLKGSEGCQCDPNDLTAAQKTIVNNQINEAISNLAIQIDAGNVDPDVEEPEVIPVYVEPSDIDHEKLGGLLGGSEDGYYHLTSEELQKLKSYPAVAQIMNSLNGDHEKLTNLKGGNSDGHFHLTNDERSKLLLILSALINSSGEVELPSDVENKLTRETWTFELEDGSSYTRDVALWT